MKKPLDTFCLCFTLETGAYLLGISGLIATILIIVRSTLALGHVIEVTDPETKLMSRIIGGVIVIFVCILLLIGTKDRNSYLLLPYLILHKLGTAFHTYRLLCIIINAPSSPPPQLIGLYFVFAIFIAIATYIWMCMMSLYAKIRNAKINPCRVYIQFSMDIEPTKMQSEKGSDPRV